MEMCADTSYPLPGVPAPNQLHDGPAARPEERDVHRVEEAVTRGGQHPVEASHPPRAARIGVDEEEEEEGSHQTSGPESDEGVVDEGGGQLDGSDEHDRTGVHAKCQQGKYRDGHLILHPQHCQGQNKQFNWMIY